jgi:hypothetical protein
MRQRTPYVILPGLVIKSDIEVLDLANATALSLVNVSWISIRLSCFDAIMA